MNFCHAFRVKPGKSVRLKDFDPADTAGHVKEKALLKIEKNVEKLFKQQEILYAENKRSLLIILQGMDAAGKDGVIRHVMRGLNPQGCDVTPFKAPSTEEMDHDFLWRIHKAVPSKGDIGIFNRSHYEDVLVVKVRKLVSKDIIKERYKQINHFEKMLTQNGMTILKFFLHISADEQKERLQARLKDPRKNWKFNERDLEERKLWDDYMEAYVEAFKHCSTDWAPWYLIPADKKWFRNLAVSEIIDETLEKMDLRLPPPLTNINKIKIV